MKLIGSLLTISAIVVPCLAQSCLQRTATFIADNTFSLAGCPSGSPQAWTDCGDSACQSAMELAIADLECCTVDFLNDQIYGGNDRPGSERSFVSVIELCGLDITDIRPEADSPSCAVDQCDLTVIDWLAEADRDTSECPEGNPGTWTTCEGTCVTLIQSAADELACCAADFLETLVGGNRQDYATPALVNVLGVCNTDTANVFGGCALDQCDLQAFPLVDTVDVSECQTNVDGTNPGFWDNCPTSCANAIQSVFDRVDCCAVDFLETFVGGNQQEYANGAFTNVVAQCGLDVSNAVGSCGSAAGASSDATSLRLSLATFAVAAVSTLLLKN